MKDILEALKTAIAAGMTEIKGVYVVADPDLLPSRAQFPCVGLKDGSTRRSAGMGESVDETPFVDIYVYQQLLQDDEASIMGAGNQKGLLELVDDLIELLDFNLLDDIVESAFCGDVMASETMLAEGDVFIQRKGCRYVYEK
jgi:hypothetical protein